MIKELEERLALKQRMQSAVDASDIVSFFKVIFERDVRFRVILLLAKREGACLSEISRNVEMSRKNLARHMEMLAQNGIVEAYSVGMRDRVYRLADQYRSVRQLLLQTSVQD